MKNCLTLIIILVSSVVIGQNPIEAEKLVRDGVNFHDSGDYKNAIVKYDSALKLDKNNLLALSEKAMTLNAMKLYDDAIAVSKLAIESHKNEDVKNVYVSYANSLDHQGNTGEALKIYNEGLRKYPDYYQLHYNKGITLANSKNYSDALLSFQNAIKANPRHGSSLNAIGILEMENNRIPSILAFSRFLIVENQSSRARTNFNSLQKLMSKGVSQKEDKSITILIDPGELSKTNSKNSQPNDFSSTDLILSMAAALDYDQKNKDKTDCEKFIEKFDALCSSLSELKKGTHGFYWEYLVPYFIEMKKNKMIEPFAYIAFLPTQSDDVVKWHKSNAKTVSEFYEWSNGFIW